ncbi:MAG: hypothetical protein ABJZ55_16340 [Fuerstiella sp.]
MSIENTYDYLLEQYPDYFEECPWPQKIGGKGRINHTKACDELVRRGVLEKQDDGYCLKGWKPE